MLSRVQINRVSNFNREISREAGLHMFRSPAPEAHTQHAHSTPPPCTHMLACKTPKAEPSRSEWLACTFSQTSSSTQALPDTPPPHTHTSAHIGIACMSAACNLYVNTQHTHLESLSQAGLHVFTRQRLTYTWPHPPNMHTNTPTPPQLASPQNQPLAAQQGWPVHVHSPAPHVHATQHIHPATAAAPRQ